MLQLKDSQATASIYSQNTYIEMSLVLIEAEVFRSNCVIHIHIRQHYIRVSELAGILLYKLTLTRLYYARTCLWYTMLFRIVKTIHRFSLYYCTY